MFGLTNMNFAVEMRLLTLQSEKYHDQRCLACSRPLTQNQNNMAFVLVTDDELAVLIDSKDSLNTKKQIQYAVGRLGSYAEFTGTTLEAVEAMTNGELDTFLGPFYAGLRKADGNLCTKKTMHAIKYGLHRRFKTLKDIDITDSAQFPQSHEAYKAFIVKLKKSRQGGYSPQESHQQRRYGKDFRVRYRGYLYTYWFAE